MKKEEIYDYLAQIYLDKKSNKSKKPFLWKKPLFLIPVIAKAGLSLYFLFFKHPARNFSQPDARSLFMAVGGDIIRINYNFVSSSMKREGYALSLAGIDISAYRQLAFRARNSVKDNTVKLKIEIENGFKEKSFVYIPLISQKWKDFYVGLAQLKGITSWDNIKQINFTVEEWNTKSRKDTVYIDNIRFLNSE